MNLFLLFALIKSPLPSRLQHRREKRGRPFCVGPQGPPWRHNLNKPSLIPFFLKISVSSKDSRLKSEKIVKKKKAQLEAEAYISQCKGGPPLHRLIEGMKLKNSTVPVKPSLFNLQKAKAARVYFQYTSRG